MGQKETHEVDPKGNTRERPETKFPGAGSQLDAGEVLGPQLWLLEVCCCFSWASAPVSPPVTLDHVYILYITNLYRVAFPSKLLMCLSSILSHDIRVSSGQWLCLVTIESPAPRTTPGP